MEDLYSFERFKRIIKVIQEFDEKQKKIEDFFEKELMSSWCMMNYGQNIVEHLIYILADEYNCWYPAREDYLDFEDGQFVTKKRKERNKEWWNTEGIYYAGNDISWWLYEAPEGEKVIEVDGVEHDLTDLMDFHKYLLGNLKRQE